MWTTGNELHVVLWVATKIQKEYDIQRTVRRDIFL